MRFRKKCILLWAVQIELDLDALEWPNVDVISVNGIRVNPRKVTALLGTASPQIP